MLLLLAFLNWLLPATAYFFDRWRLAVPILLVGIWGYTLLLSNEGHHYRVQPTRLSASEIHLLVDAFEKEGKQQITLEHFPVFMDKYVAEKDFRVPLSWHVNRKEERVVYAAAAKLRKVLAAV